MKLQDIIDAWDAQPSAHQPWGTLSANARVEFAVGHIEKMARGALDDLAIAVYHPERSGVSVAHAIGHVAQVFYSDQPRR